MKSVLTQGIVLARTDYGETDRIITLLTPDHGKLRLIAKGVRKSSSKMAGGIELFSISEISFIQSKGEIGTLVSTRLLRHFPDIIKDINRTMLGYELIKQLNRATEDAPESEYFGILSALLEGLNDLSLGQDILQLWFQSQMLRQAGHSPNLRTDGQDKSLDPNERYAFDMERMVFTNKEQGSYTANHIKFLRLLFGVSSPEILTQVKETEAVLPMSRQLVQSMYAQFIQR